MQDYRRIWNDHRLRSVGKSPNQLLFENSELAGSSVTIIINKDYGIDGESDNEDEDGDEANQVVVHPIECPIQANDELVQPLAAEDIGNMDTVLDRVREAVRILLEIVNAYNEH